MRVLSVAAHAHYLGKEIKATATKPDGSIEPLLWIQDWDFNWQDRYDYKTPVFLPKGTRIDARLPTTTPPTTRETRATPRVACDGGCSRSTRWARSVS